MKFTATVPVTEMKAMTYDVELSKKEEEVIKTYEKWYNDMSDENKDVLINAIVAMDSDFDKDQDSFEDYVFTLLDNIKFNIYKKEVNGGNTTLDNYDKIQCLMDGKFKFE